MGEAGRPSLAVVGLGRMGGPMADCAVAAGLAVSVHDVDRSAVRARVERGATAAASVAEAVAGADVVAVVVFDDEQARAVIAGPDGVLAAASPSAVVVLHTTVTVETILELGALAAQRGLGFLDAGISGGEGGARAGTLVTMVGGDPEALERARPALETYSRELVHAGPLGAGMALKLARNAVGYSMMAAGWEALALTHASGVDPEVLRHVLDVTDMPTMLVTALQLGGPSPLPADADPAVREAMEHTLRLGEKDLAQALALARHHGLELPVATAAVGDLAPCLRLAPG